MSRAKRQPMYLREIRRRTVIVRSPDEDMPSCVAVRVSAMSRDEQRTLTRNDGYFARERDGGRITSCWMCGVDP